MYIWALVTKNIGSNIRRWQKTTQSSKQPVIMVGGVSQASVCQPQTIIIPNYCSNYFNIITAPLPTVGLATYSTGKYILIFSTFFKDPLWSQDMILCFCKMRLPLFWEGRGLPALLKLSPKLLTLLRELHKVSHLWFLLVLCSGQKKNIYFLQCFESGYGFKEYAWAGLGLCFSNVLL